MKERVLKIPHHSSLRMIELVQTLAAAVAAAVAAVAVAAVAAAVAAGMGLVLVGWYTRAGKRARTALETLLCGSNRDVL